jgi:hypothetical protein
MAGAPALTHPHPAPSHALAQAYVLCGVATEPITSNQAEYLALWHGMQVRGRVGMQVGPGWGRPASRALCFLTLLAQHSLQVRRLVSAHCFCALLARLVLQAARSALRAAVLPTHALRLPSSLPHRLGGLPPRAPLQNAVELGAQALKVQGDSELVIRQVSAQSRRLERDAHVWPTQNGKQVQASAE